MALLAANIKTGFNVETSKQHSKEEWLKVSCKHGHFYCGHSKIVPGLKHVHWLKSPHSEMENWEPFLTLFPGIINVHTLDTQTICHMLLLTPQPIGTKKCFFHGQVKGHVWHMVRVSPAHPLTDDAFWVILRACQCNNKKEWHYM